MIPAHAPPDRALAPGLKRTPTARGERKRRSGVPAWATALFGVDLAFCLFIGVTALTSALDVDPRAQPAQWTSICLWVVAAVVCAIGDAGLLRRGDWGLRWALVGLALVMISLMTNGALYWIGRLGAAGDGDAEWIRLAGGASVTGWAVAKSLRLAYNVLYFLALAHYSRAAAGVGERSRKT